MFRCFVTGAWACKAAFGGPRNIGDGCHAKHIWLDHYRIHKIMEHFALRVLAGPAQRPCENKTRGCCMNRSKAVRKTNSA